MSKKTNSYAEIALEVVAKFKCGEATEPRQTWKCIAQGKFPGREAAPKKSCPMTAFLGLCEEGLVKYIPGGSYTRSIKNKDYAIQAVTLLRKNPELSVSELWKRIDKDNPEKVHNDQMDVAKALFDAGFINAD